MPPSTQKGRNWLLYSQNLVKRIDYLGKKFYFKFDSTTSDSYQTTLGGYITVLLVLICTVLFIPIFGEFLNTTKPTIATSKQLGSTVKSFNLYQDDLYFYMAFGKHLNFIKDFRRYATVKLRVYSQHYNFSTGSFDFEMHHDFEYVHCTSLEENKMTKNSISLSAGIPGFKNFLLCPDFKGNEKDYRIDENGVTFTSRRAEIHIYPCSLEDPTQCATPDELGGLTAWYYDLRKLLKPENYTHPVEARIRVSRLILSPTMTKYVEVGVSKNKIYDTRFELRGLSFREEFSSMEVVREDVSAKTAKYHCTQNELGLFTNRGRCAEYLSIVYIMNGDEVIIKRNYTRLTAILGEFGGVLKLVTSMLFFLYGVYNNSALKGFVGGRAGLEYAKKDEVFLKGLMEFQQEEKLGKEDEIDGDGNGLGVEGHEAEVAVNRIEVSDKIIKENKNSHNCEENSKFQILKRKMKNNKEFGLEKVLENCTKARTGITDVLAKLNFVEFLQEVFMEEHDKILLPIALLKARQLRMIEKAVSHKEEEKIDKGWGKKKRVFPKKQVKTRRRTASKKSFNAFLLHWVSEKSSQNCR